VSILRQRIGTLAAFVVGVTVLVLYVTLQPGERPTQATVTTTTTTTVTTTTIDPIEQLCTLGREFQEGSIFQDPNVTARLGETFYARARELAAPDARPEYAAAAAYYEEYNNIGEQYGYDLLAILNSPDGPRWQQLLFRAPLGVDAARANVAFICGVELPPPPTITTTTTTRPRPATTVGPPVESTPPVETPPPDPGTPPPAPG
jgi:hypothetical protein